LEGLTEWYKGLPSWAKWAVPLGAVAIVLIIWAPWRKKSSNANSTIALSNGTALPIVAYGNPITVANSRGAVNVANGTTPVSTTPTPVQTESPATQSQATQEVQIYNTTLNNATFTVANQTATPQERLSALAVANPTSLPGVPASVVGLDKTLATNPAVTGVLSNGVIVINPYANFSAVQNALQYGKGVSIPGVSSAKVAYLQSLARQNKLSAQIIKEQVGGAYIG